VYVLFKNIVFLLHFFGKGLTMKKLIVAATLLACGLFATSAQSQGEKKAEPKCPVSGKKIDKEQSVDFNGGKVYFCCGNCPKAFEKDPKKFTAKANMQLVVTGQAKQVKCAFTGGNLNPDTKISVAGTDVCFCCMNCQGKAKDMETPKAIEAIFGEKGFKKGFEVKKTDSK